MINDYSIRHTPKSNYCFAYDDQTIEIRFKIKTGELKKLELLYGDKYDWSNYKKVEMEKAFSDEKFDYYITRISPPNKRLGYYFKLYEKRRINKVYYYTQWGFLEDMDEKDEETVKEYSLNYPYLNKEDILKVPQWVKNAIFYQIFPERFYNGDDSISPPNTVEWDSKPTRENFFGGDLAGIIEKLDYLSELGVNAIYLNPVFEATTNHKYDTIDYKKIDPNFGDKETLKKLVKKAHEIGIRVVLDCVFNHSGYKFDKFLDVKKKGEASKFKDWFYIKDYPVSVEKRNYETFGFEPKMPKLNTENEDVIEYLIDVATYWIKEADIDGWRLDVSNEIDHKFWRKFRDEVKKVKSDAYIVGEIWHHAGPWLEGDQFDSVMNYPVQRACYEYFAKNMIDRNNFKNKINKTYFDYYTQANEVMMNLLDSHDTARFLTEADGNTNKLLMAFVFELFYPGCMSIYYGTEIGMLGGKDPDCRRTMKWNKDKWDIDLFEEFKRLIKIAKDYTVFNNGEFRWVEDSKVLAYKRVSKNEEIRIYINDTQRKKKIKIDEMYDAVSLLKNEKVSEINLKKDEYEIIKVVRYD